MKHFYFIGILLVALLSGCNHKLFLLPCKHVGLSHASDRSFEYSLKKSVIQFNSNGELITHPIGITQRRRPGLALDSIDSIASRKVDSLFITLKGKNIPESFTRESIRNEVQNAYLNNMFNALKRGRKKHIIVFVNGGLNDYETGMNRAKQILNDDQGHEISRSDTAFLFINWNSALLSTYSEHLITHQGTVVPSGHYPGMLFWAPHNLIADAGRTVATLPMLGWQYATQPGIWALGFKPTNALYTQNLVQPALKHERQQVNQQAYVLATSMASTPWQAMRISLPPSQVTGSFVPHVITPLVLNAPSTFLLAVFPLLYASPVLGVPWEAGLANIRLATLVGGDFIGRPAWTSMLRRTQVMFVRPRPEETAENVRFNASGSLAEIIPRMGRTRVRISPVQTEPGVLPRFIENLIKYQKEHPGTTVTLIGHSMGTIVVSEILRDALQREGDKLVCDNIVFLAAACPLRDIRTKVVPYMQANNQANFYNLTLHPYAELSENMLSVGRLGGLLLDGSLLVYIDRLLTTPLTPQERTAGRWHNFVLATTDPTFIPSSVRNRVTLKAFGAGNRDVEGPQIHGDLASVFLFRTPRDRTARYRHYFWSEEFRRVP